MALMDYLTESPESPIITGDESGSKIQRIYYLDNADVSSVQTLIPAKGTLIDDAGGYFDTYSIKHGPGYSLLTMELSSSLDFPEVGEITRDGEIKYALSVDRIEKSVGAHPNFKMIWIYNLYCFVAAKDDAITDPNWSETAVNFSDANGVDFVWSKDHPGNPPDGFWKLAASMTKPDLESYAMAAPVVVARKFCKNKKKAEAFLRTSVGLADPGDRFGFAASSAPTYRWLAYPVGITTDGKFWIAENEYHYADEWDTDLYTVG